MTYNGTCFIASSEMDLNIYTLEQWEQMETAGAVFLPVTGFRHPNLGVVDASNQGVYWQGQQNTIITTVSCVNFSFFSSSNAIYPSNVSEVYSMGMAVRLVTPYEDHEGITSPSLQGRSGEASKVLRNGVLYIKRNGKTYNAQGAEVR